MSPLTGHPCPSDGNKLRPAPSRRPLCHLPRPSPLRARSAARWSPGVPPRRGHQDAGPWGRNPCVPLAALHPQTCTRLRRTHWTDSVSNTGTLNVRNALRIPALMVVFQFCAETCKNPQNCAVYPERNCQLDLMRHRVTLSGSFEPPVREPGPSAARQGAGTAGDFRGAKPVAPASRESDSGVPGLVPAGDAAPPLAVSEPRSGPVGGLRLVWRWDGRTGRGSAWGQLRL